MTVLYAIGPLSGIENDLLLCQRNSRLVTSWKRKCMRAMIKLCVKVEIDRNIIKSVLDILNNILIIHMRDMKSVIFT